MTPSDECVRCARPQLQADDRQTEAVRGDTDEAQQRGMLDRMIIERLRTVRTFHVQVQQANDLALRGHRNTHIVAYRSLTGMLTRQGAVRGINLVKLALPQRPAVIGAQHEGVRAFRRSPRNDVFEQRLRLVEQVQGARRCREYLAGEMPDDGIRFLQGATGLQVGIELIDPAHIAIVPGQVRVRTLQFLLEALVFRDVGR